jgi:hypothetical protein
VVVVVSLLVRLRVAPPFLSAVLAHLLTPGGHGTPQTPGLRIRDATVIRVPGSTGSDWRIHADFDPTTLRLRAVELTDHTGGERLTRWDFARGDVVLGDRVFGTAQGLPHLADDGAHGLLRTHPAARATNGGARAPAATRATPQPPPDRRRS